MAESQIITLSDFTGGIKNASQNPLASAPNTVWDARNVEFLASGGFRVRKGAVPVGYVAAVAGAVVLSELNTSQSFEFYEPPVDPIQEGWLWDHYYPVSASGTSIRIRLTFDSVNYEPSFSFAPGNGYVYEMYLYDKADRDDITGVVPLNKRHYFAFSDEEVIPGGGWSLDLYQKEHLLVHFWTDWLTTPIVSGHNYAVIIKGLMGGGSPSPYFYANRFTFGQSSRVGFSGDDFTVGEIFENSFYVSGLEVRSSGAAGGISKLAQVRFPLNGTQALLAQTVTEGAGDSLYARLNTVSEDDVEALTDLLDGTYPFGLDSEPMSVTTLGDRAIIAHPDHVPLVYGRCHSVADPPTDWMYPKAVLWSQDGEHYEDITRYVCDPDIDTVAPIDNMRPTGQIAICCDMPDVDGFYFEMDSANTGSGLSNVPQQYSQFYAETYIDRENVQGIAAKWVQDAGTGGHFETGASAPVTIGAGKDAPYIEVGMDVIFADATVQIVSITPDGEGSGEVTLSEAHISADVTGIYGITVTASDVLQPTRGYADALSSVYAKAMTTYAAFDYCTVRIPIAGADISADGTGGVLITLKGTDVVIGEAGIVERSGSTANGTTTPTQLYFGNSAGYEIQGAGTVTCGPKVHYPIDNSKGYLICLSVRGRTVSHASVYASG